MADVALQFVVQAMVTIIQENRELIVGAKGNCEQLVEELNSLNAFLHDAAKYRKSNSDLWKHFVRKVQVTVYKAEGLIDQLLVQVKLHQEQNIVKKVLDSFNYATSVRDLAINIKSALEQVKKIREENPAGFQPKQKLEDQPEEVAPSQQDILLEENEVVGFDEEAEIVIKRLDEGTKDLDVIPVVGLPGLGKTTLARKIYSDPNLSFKFFNSIWVYIGREYKLKEVLLKIIEVGYKKSTAEYQHMNVNELVKIISKEISSGGKCLIVLDDVWSPNIVIDIRKVFPENKKGHRIMITTRDGGIGRYANAEPHSLKFLTDEESFQLLENRVFGSNKSRCPEELVAHGKNIAIKCRGVPLAVVVIAGVLQGSLSQNKWKRVEDNVGEHLFDPKDPNSCMKFVEMSYGHLDEDMKACFLYCGAFPQGFEIPAWKLIRLWISEGLINSTFKASLERKAEEYLSDLVNRNFLMVLKKSSDGQVKTCRLHDLLYQFCKMEAKSGGFFQEVSENADQNGLDIPDLNITRRLCIQQALLKPFISKGQCADHVRSFLCFSTKQKGSEKLSREIQLLHKAFPLVKVMDIETLSFSFSKYFKERHHLRYIAISLENNSVPAFFGKFWYLQTLILNTKADTIEIKADIWNMLHLRHLHTNAPAKLPSPLTKTTEEPSSLQTLSIVAPESCKEDVLARACNLKKVSIKGKMCAFFDTNKGEFSNFEKLKCLENWKLLNDDIDSSMSKPLQLPPTFFVFLRKLKKLTLSNTRFAWSDAYKLGQLECLEVLKLKEFAFRGTAWESEGFSQLKVLWIERADLETWKASTLQFQKLKFLYLISCEKLEAVPFEFAGVSSLQEMKLENTIKANKSAKAILSRKMEMQRILKAAESNSGTQSQAPGSFKFKLTIFPPETTECE